MNIQNMVRIVKIILLATAVSVATLALIYALQHLDLLITLATVSWNGDIF